MSTPDVAIPSTSLSPKKLLDASSPIAGSVFFILRAADHLLACGPVGNTFAILSSTLPASTNVAPPALSRCNTNTAPVIK
ncbi:hypothetical protein EDD85DRAFT_951725 [Armillaria nabsnona]|nr:hypothetical protein EDD85DRAFT_951725 [Armillaria nabsnona]